MIENSVKNNLVKYITVNYDTEYPVFEDLARVFGLSISNLLDILYELKRTRTVQVEGSPVTTKTYTNGSDDVFHYCEKFDDGGIYQEVTIKGQWGYIKHSEDIYHKKKVINYE